MPLIYSVDTSALLDGWSRRYPPTNFPRLWGHIDQLVNDQRFVMSEEVFEEVKEHDDGLKAWVTERRGMVVVDTDASIAAAVRSILQAHERLVMNGARRNRGDPFVIAVAQLRGATVLTGEQGGTVAKPKIPSVCSALQIPCVGFLGLIQAEGWIFA